MQIGKIIPIFNALNSYNKRDFQLDLISGITVAIMLVPQGMAYAYLAGMPPIYGLYGGLIPLFLYAILGTSRHLSIGPVAVSSLLILAGVSQIAEPGTSEYVQLVILAGLLIGLLQLLLGLLKFGFLVNFLSHPVLVGFSSAAAVIIAVSQLKDVLGFHIPRFPHAKDTFLYAIDHIAETQWLPVVLCVSGIIIMLVCRKVSRSIPGALLIVIAGILIAWFFQLQENGLAIVKDVPEGLPPLTIPVFSWETIRSLMPTVLTVTIIGVVECIGIAKVMEAKTQDHTVYPNKELIAIGISKMGGSLFQALPTSGSFTRSAINLESGGRTGISSIITALLIGLTLLFLTPLFYYLPKAILAAIILMAVKSLFDYPEAIRLWKTHRQDFFMMLVTFFVTLALGIEEGVFTGVLLSVSAVLYRSSRPHIAVLGKLPNSPYYRNINRFEDAVQEEGVLIIRFDDQLYFGNAAYFKEKVKAIVTAQNQEVKLVIIDASNIHDMDSSGLRALEEINAYLKEKQIQFYLASMIGPLRDLIFKSGLMKTLGERNQFMNVDDAVCYFKNDPSNEDDNWTPDAIQTNLR